MAISKSGDVLCDQTHRELVYRPLQFHKGGQDFIGAHNEALSVAAMESQTNNASPLAKIAVGLVGLNYSTEVVQDTDLCPV
jgi:hypothetical protein